jgi:hypothetical protein
MSGFIRPINPQIREQISCSETVISDESTLHPSLGRRAERIVVGLFRYFECVINEASAGGGGPQQRH